MFSEEYNLVSGTICNSSTKLAALGVLVLLFGKIDEGSFTFIL